MKTIFAALIALLLISTNRASAADQFNHFNVSLGGGYAFSQVTQDPDPVHTQGITFDQSASPRLGFEYQPLSWFGLELSTFGENVKAAPNGGGIFYTQPSVGFTWGTYRDSTFQKEDWNQGTYTFHLALQPRFYYNTKWVSAFIGGGAEYSHLSGDYEANVTYGAAGSPGYADQIWQTWKIHYTSTITEWSPIASFGAEGHFGKHFSVTLFGERTWEKQEVRFGNGTIISDPSYAYLNPVQGQLLATIENPWRANLIVSYSF